MAVPDWAGEFAARPYGRWHRSDRATSNDCRWPRLRSLIAIAAAVGALVILGHSALMHSHAHPAHPPHPLLTSVGSEFAVNVDHPHLVDGWSSPCHQLFATPVLLRSANDLIALGAVVTATALMDSLAQRAVPTVRGPPWAPATLTGQDLLTRFCVTRR
ncbi:putative copper homeostasis (lipo)protein LpqS [Mycobacterium ostraviense]|uniref:Lipoprotein LpqS n=1 Tax=Mycobacterium ostraviense TaxID=2738409 RepID=A0A163YJX5_9MYCO|nr:hypothetical protein A4G28_21850 [Mycobacterium ostraviense]